ncbi:MAG: phosphatidylglycerophosphatase A [Thermodesulfobacteriota bacterium]|nr:phosphatidylglycerophosphatase A [Thermodesulfobacteriota bacterium]
MHDRFIRIAATGLGSGLSPFAPGTAGTLVGILLYMVFSRFSWSLYLLSVIAFSLFAVYVSREAERIYNEKDPGRIVIDEIAGFQVTMFLVAPTVWHIFWGFIIFRIFDIIKPFPIRLCERKLPGGYGVVGDDIVAGIYGNILLLLLIRFVV